MNSRVSAVLPILESEQRLHVCSWLHDGLTVFCADPHEAPRQLKRLEQAIVEEAALMQVYTKLEIELSNRAKIIRYFAFG